MGRYILSEEEYQFVKQNYFKMPNKKICECLGFSERILGRVVKELKLSKKRKINSSYFKHIDTPMKAYFMGFIFADGWLVYSPENYNYELGIELQRQDEYVLDCLNKELGSQNIVYHEECKDYNIHGKIAHKGPSSILRVYSKEIVEDLMSHGVMPRKTLRDILPDVPDEFFFDFLRGYIDGDGCFFECKGYTYMHITCASILVMKQLQQRILKFGIETKVYSFEDKKHRLQCVNTIEMDKLVNMLYKDDDDFCLTRKKKRIEHYLGFAV